VSSSSSAAQSSSASTFTSPFHSSSAAAESPFAAWSLAFALVSLPVRPLLCRLLRARLHRPLFPSVDASTARGASTLHTPDIDAGEIAGDIDAMHGLRQHLVRVRVRSTQLPEGRAFDTDAAVQRNARGVGSAWAFNAVTAAPHEISRGWAVYRLVEYVCCVVCFYLFLTVLFPHTFISFHFRFQFPHLL
jgi:hypothetical protein